MWRGIVIEDIEARKNRKGYNQGIFIDIFPCIAVKDTWIERKKYVFLSWCKAYIGERYTGNAFLRKFFIKRARSLHIGWEEKEALVVRSLEFVEPQFSIKVRDLLPLREVTFEGQKFLAPNNPDAYLKSLYGDNYMELPPPEKRITHANFIKIFD